MYLMWIAGGKK